MVKWNLFQWIIPSGIIPWIIQYTQINVVYHINKMKNKNHMITSTVTNKTFDKI